MLRPYFRAVTVETKTSLAYWGNIVGFLSAVLIPPLAVFFLWRAVLGAGGTLGNYDLSAMVTYYVVVQFFVANTPFSAWYEIGEEIRNGRLLLWLVRPASHYGLYLSRNLGGWIPYWLLSSLGATVVAGILHRYFLVPGEWWQAPVAVGFWLLGVILAFNLGYTLNLLAFWTERTTGFAGVADVAATFLSGGFVPLDVLPLREVWLFLPFRFVGWLPAQIFLGRVKPGELPLEFGVLVLWLAISVVIAKGVRTLGLRRYRGAGI